MESIYSFSPDQKYQGDQDFEKFLIEVKAPFTVWEVKSFVLGIVLGIEFIQPSWVMKEILLLGTEGEFRFKDEEEFLGFLKRFFGLWNEMAGFQNADDGPGLSPVLDVIANEELIHAVELREREIDNFLIGLGESGSLNIAKKHKRYHAIIENLEEILDDLITIGSILVEDATEIEYMRARQILERSKEIFQNGFHLIVKTLFKVRAGSNSGEDCTNKN